MYRKVLVPLDGSELAERVLPHARALAEMFGARVVLLSIPIYPVFDPLSADPVQIAAVYDRIRRETTEYLLRIAAPLKQAGLNVTVEMREGPVADTILECADQIGADIIAMSTHGRSGVTRWLLGSVADRVVRGGKIPVLLIRPSLAPEHAPGAQN